MIVISGITSSLGIAAAKRLAAKGYKVRGFSRSAPYVRVHLDHPNIELIAADLNDSHRIRSICSSAAAVVHCGALSSPWGEYSDFYQVNVNGTRKLLEAAHEKNVGTFVHISTPSIYFDFSDRYQVAETGIAKGKLVNKYALTKKMAEELVAHYAQTGMKTIALRPRAIFGPHDRTLLPRILKACEKKGLPRLGKTSPIVDVTFVENVAQAIELGIGAPSALSGETYNITNGEPVPLWSLLERLHNKLSIPFRSKRIPYPLAYMAATLAEWKGRLLNREPLLTRYGIGVLAYSQTLSIEKARHELGYHPEISLETGIDRYVDWLQTT